MRDHLETSNARVVESPAQIAPGQAIVPEALWDDAKAAQFLGGLHPKTVQRMARRGELPAYRIGKYWRYRASELSAWLVVHSSGQIHPPAHTRKEIQ